MIFCIVKVLDPRKKVGIDPAVTTLYALVHLAANVAAVVFYNKYVSYHARINPMKNSTTKKAKFSAAQLKRFQNAVILIDFTTTLLIFASGFSNFNKDVGILKAALTIHSLRTAYFIWASIFYLDLLLVDLRRVCKTAKNHESERKHYSMRSTGTANGTMRRVLKFHSNQIIALVRIKKATAAYNSFLFFIYFIPLVWKMW
mmetsp:Transcript_16943/g.21676  ORF Transcript_16943/g.21676 Transcript_16943/m.21676 type:complete len:201 (-) Transcript_16943:363-965(-)